MQQDPKKMRTRYWYGKPIKAPKEVLAAFFDFAALESGQNFLADIITHADSSQQYKPADAAQSMIKYYALLSLLAASYNIVNSGTMQQALLEATLPGVKETEANMLKRAAIASVQATFELYSLKQWRYHLFDILNHALASYPERVAINLPSAYIQLKGLLEAAAFLNNCLSGKPAR